MQPTRSTFLLIFLVALSISGPLSINFYLALLPAMADSLVTDAATIQLTVSVYLSGFASAQLIIGPLSDRYGRKPILIYCYSLFLLASLVCAFSNSYELLIAARFLQSLGGSAGVLISRAIVRDIYPLKEMGKAMSYLVTGFSIAPLIAPVMGGYIGTHLGWRSLFFILAGFGLCLIMWTFWGFTETNVKRDPDAFKWRPLIKNYFFLLTNKHFFGYLLVVSSSIAGILTYTSASSFVLIEVLQVPAHYYGWLFSITALGMFLGSILSARLNKHMSTKNVAFLGVILLLTGGILLAILPLINVLSVISIVGSMLIYALGNGLVMSSATALAIIPFPEKAGTAVALLGFSQGALGALCGFIAGQLYNGTVIPMTLIIGLLSLLSFIGIMVTRVEKAFNET